MDALHAHVQRLLAAPAVEGEALAALGPLFAAAVQANADLAARLPSWDKQAFTRAPTKEELTDLAGELTRRS